MKDEIIIATDEALRHVVEPRFLRTERGFHGQFYAALQRVLQERGLLQGGRVLEMEYQKSTRHGTSQRPDIVLHIPTENSGAGVATNNFAVWALKRGASLKQAQADFDKLDEMFERLCYSVGIFINIDKQDNFAPFYKGQFPERLQTVAVWLDCGIVTKWSGYDERRINKALGGV